MPAPQPQFTGQTPSEAVGQAEDFGSKWAQIVSQGVQEGVRAHQFNKQLKQVADLQAQAEHASSDQLKMQLLQRDISTKMTEAGPGNEAKVFSENEPLVKQLLKFYSNGDEVLANSMYEGISKKFVEDMAPSDLLKNGYMGFSSGQETQPNTNPNTDTVAQPSTETQPNTPSTGAQTQTQAPTAIPTKDTDFTPDVVKQVASNSDLMNQFRDTLKKQKPNDANWSNGIDKASNEALINNNKITLMGLGKASGSTGTLSQYAKALPTGAKAAIASQAFSKIETGDPNVPITNKEKVAMNGAAQSTLKVLDSAQTRAYLANGGSKEVLDRAAKSLNNAIAADPDLGQYFKSTEGLSPRDAAAYGAQKAAAFEAWKTVSQLGIDKEKADADMIRATTERDKITVQKRTDALTFVQNSIKSWSEMDEVMRKDLTTQNKGITDTQIDAERNRRLQNPNDAYTAAYGLAAQALSQYSGMPIGEVKAKLNGSSWTKAIGAFFTGEKLNPTVDSASIPTMPDTINGKGVATPNGLPSTTTVPGSSSSTTTIESSKPGTVDPKYQQQLNKWTR